MWRRRETTRGAASVLPAEACASAQACGSRQRQWCVNGWSAAQLLLHARAACMHARACAAASWLHAVALCQHPRHHVPAIGVPRAHSPRPAAARKPARLVAWLLLSPKLDESTLSRMGATSLRERRPPRQDNVPSNTARRPLLKCGARASPDITCNCLSESESMWSSAAVLGAASCACFAAEVPMIECTI